MTEHVQSVILITLVVILAILAVLYVIVKFMFVEILAFA